MYKKSKIKFLLFPLVFRGRTYWMQNVVITKHFNGYRYIITSVEVI